MHLNALYRAAQAGKQALTECMHALTGAAKWNGYDPRSLVGKPLKYWHLRNARRCLDEAKQQLQVVRDNISLVASTGAQLQIDSSGGYAISDLLSGGLLDELVALQIDRRITIERIDALRIQVDELMLRMRMAGAVA